MHPKPVRFYISAHGCAQNPPGFRPKPLARLFEGRMLLRPIRIRVKFIQFHNSTPEYVKHAPDFTFPNKDTPKTHPILDANPCRRRFRGVCFCALHGYMQNPSGFTFSYPDTSKTHPISPFPIRIRPKPTRFYTQTFGAGHFGAYAIRPYTGT